jgi:hypothetical protein
MTDRTVNPCRRPDPLAGRRVPCLDALALGWSLPTDLCPDCTRAFMDALDGISGPLEWHENFSRRAEETR